MANENRNEILRNGLVQYIGALMSETKKEGAEAMHIALAQLSEVWLECAKTKDNHYDMFIAKPILRAASLLLIDYSNQLVNEAPEDFKEQVAVAVNSLRQNAKALQSLVDNIKGSTNT